MKNILDVIKQTNRTILFEEINPNLDYCLSSFIGNNDAKVIDGELNKEITKKLSVKSFDEFLKKFKPTIYTTVSEADNELGFKINYSVKKLNDTSLPIPLIREHKLIKMLIELIETRKDSVTKENYAFNFKSILSALSVKELDGNFQEGIKDLSNLLEKINKLDKNNPKRKELKTKLNSNFKKMRELYDNPIESLPLAINNGKRKIEYVLSLGVGNNKENTKAPILKELIIGDDGRLLLCDKLDQENKNNVKLIAHSDAKNPKSALNLPTIIEKDFNKHSKSKNKNALALIKNVIAPLNSDALKNISLDKEQKLHEVRKSAYKESLENLKSIFPLLEKIMGVYLFFEQDDTEGKNLELLITNNKLAKNKKEDLEKFFEYTNNGKNYESTIWFSIIPNVSLNDLEEYEEDDDVLGDDDFLEDNDLENKFKKETNSLDDLTRLVNTLANYKIQTFFNPESKMESSFSYIASNGLNNIINDSKMLVDKDYSDYLILCLPNITLVSNDKSVINVGSSINENFREVKDDDEDLVYLGGVYVDASYIAAGLVAAYQNPKYLTEKFKSSKIENSFPGVRFNIEDGDNNKKVKTILAKEISGFTNIIKKQIKNESLGFIFDSGDENISVLIARCLRKKENGHFEEIYRTTTATFIERCLNQETEMKENKVKHFFSNDPKSFYKELEKYKEKVNGVYQEGDNFSYNDETLNLSFKGEDKMVSIVTNKN